jgi:hypothetical protein
VRRADSLKSVATRICPKPLLLEIPVMEDGANRQVAKGANPARAIAASLDP